MVVEPKIEPRKVTGRFSVVYHPKAAYQDVNPKTNTWWSRKEYRSIRNNICDYRQGKKRAKDVEKMKSKPFRPTSANIDSTAATLRSSKREFDPSDTNSKYSSQGVLQNCSQPPLKNSGLSNAVFTSPKIFDRPRSSFSSELNSEERDSVRGRNGQKLQALPNRIKSAASIDGEARFAESPSHLVIPAK
jgi:hypothetical protein